MLLNLIILFAFVLSTQACSDFQLKTKSGILCGRTMDFIIPMKSQVLVFNRDTEMSSMAPDGSVGLQWTSNYGFVGINAFHVELVDEGLNEVGLTCGFLVMNDSIYPPIVSGYNNVSLALTDLCMWVLSNFKNTDEVVSEMNNIRIWGNKVPVLNILMGLHVSIHDARGKNLVIEFINGEVKIYDNTLGVLTNDPPLPYQIQNLAQYTHLSPNISSTTTINGYTFKNGPNSGMHGLSGGYSPMDRYVRMATMLRFIQEDSESFSYINIRGKSNRKITQKEINQYNGLLAATRILDSVYVPSGLEIGFFPAFNKYVSGTTLWSTIKDVTNKIFYFRNSDGVIRAVNLNKINFNNGTIHSRVEVQRNEPFIIDETPNFSK